MSEINEGYYQSVDGLQLFYRDYQSRNDTDSDPVLCLPGLTRNSLDFTELASLLSDSRRVITTDLRGRGKSDYDSDRSRYHPEQYVADVTLLLAHLGISKIAVIGTSLGGLMVMLMAHERALDISAAVINDIGPDLEAAGLERVMRGAATSPAVATWDEAVAQVKSIYASAYPNWSESDWNKHTRKTFSGSTNDGFKLRVDPGVGVAAREGLSGLRRNPWDLFESLLPIPLLLIHGVRSDILGAETVKKMIRRKPDLETVEVDNRGHAPNLDEPEAINAIRTFLRRT